MAVVALADSVVDRPRGLVVPAAGTGMRLREVFGLTLPRLDGLRWVVQWRPWRAVLRGNRFSERVRHPAAVVLVCAQGHAFATFGAPTPAS